MMATTYDLGPVYRGLPQGLGQPATTQPSTWQRANSFLGSPTGQLAVGGLSAGLSAYAQGKQNDKTLAAQQQENALQREQDREKMLATLGTTMATNATNRAIGAARPIGEAQSFAASMARGNVLADLLGKGPTAPGNPAVAQAANLDTLRIDPSAIGRLKSMYSEPATLQSLLTRDQDIAAINPQSAPTNYASLTSMQQESPLTRALMSQFADYRQGAQAQLDDSESYARRILQQAIDGTSTPVGTGAASAASPFPKSPTGTATPGNTATLGGPTQPALDPTQSAVSRASVTPQIPAHTAANGRPEWGATYWEQMTNPTALREGLENGKPHDYYGGPDAPRVDQLTPKMQNAIRTGYGIALKEEDAKKVIQQGWSYGKPAPKGFEYDEDTGLLKKKGSAWKTLAKVGIIAGAGAATIFTGGAASPWLAAAIGAGAGAGVGAIDNGWKGALTGAALGGVTGGVGAGITNAGLSTAKTIGANAALGAGTGAIQGGAKGALIGAAGGGGGAAIGPATSKLSGVGQTAAQAGLNVGLNKSLGAGWTDSLISGGMAASQNAANQQKLNQYRQQQQRSSAFDAAGRLVRG